MTGRVAMKRTPGGSVLAASLSADIMTQNRCKATTANLGTLD